MDGTALVQDKWSSASTKTFGLETYITKFTFPGSSPWFELD
jgi:hypothetical protein